MAIRVKETFFCASLFCALISISSVAEAGDFSSPTSYSGSSTTSAQATYEYERKALAGSSSSSGSGSGSYTLGDYYERYQSGTNWENAVLSGNTIILNGDNESVTLSNDGATVTQTSTGSCQTTSNTYLNSSGASATTSTCKSSQ